MDADTQPRRHALLRFVPIALLAMGVACGVSAGIGLAWALFGGAPAPLAVVLAPPILVAIALPFVAARRMRRDGA